MNFCSHCAQPVKTCIPEQDNRLRYVCAACGTVHYQNPKIITGVIANFGDRVLLCQRDIEPKIGSWTLPAGFMENDETCRQAALREAKEEANANLKTGTLYSVFNVPEINQVYLIYRAQLQCPEISPGFESRAVALVKEADIPWQQLAYPSVTALLQRYFRDCKSGDFPVITDQAALHQVAQLKAITP